jgi:hypothetical protein
VETFPVIREFAGPLRSLWSLWRGRRYGVRASIDLDWQHPIITSVPGPTHWWRAVALFVTAPKHEEFVVARGLIEAKTRRLARWKAVAELEDVLSLPHPVEASRQWEARISGPSLAKRLKALDLAQDEVRLRITVADWYGTKARGRDLTARISELEREEYR